MSRDDAERLQDVVEAIDRIERIQAYDAPDELKRGATLYSLVVIGEAINAISSDLLGSVPDVPWREIVRMRNRLAHAYFDVDTTVVEEVVKTHLDALSKAVEGLLLQLKAEL